MRIVCGIGTLCVLLWYLFTQPYVGNYEKDDNHTIIVIGLEVATFYLLLPIILKMCMPVVFQLIMKVFPITGLLAKRNFDATIRRYVTIAAPIVICLSLGVPYFFAVTSTQDLQEKVYLGQNMPITAVATGINLNDQLKLALSKYPQCE